uniref:SH3 domain-binding glutamic acid-rich-like protein n=1 Tax=Monodelphis domestica TaxID=13616 RepID=A0A5F8GBN2_MONDO
MTMFIASSSGFVEIKMKQQDVVRFLEANKIEFEEVDITMSEEQRQWMYKNIPPGKKPAQGNPIPPQIFNGDLDCGDYDSSFESKESNSLFILGPQSKIATKGRALGEGGEQRGQKHVWKSKGSVQQTAAYLMDGSL